MIHDKRKLIYIFQSRPVVCGLCTMLALCVVVIIIYYPKTYVLFILDYGFRVFTKSAQCNIVDFNQTNATL